MTEHDDLQATIRTLKPATRPVTAFEPPTPCNCEGCTRDAAYITELEQSGRRTGISLGACDEHITLVIRLVDQMATGNLTITEDEDS